MKSTMHVKDLEEYILHVYKYSANISFPVITDRYWVYIN